jgi:hypothetical protein
MQKRKTFTGTRGVPSMKVRGGGTDELERYRIRKLATPHPGDFAIVPAQLACDRALGPASPVCVAILLAKYRNKNSRTSIVRMTRLADELGVTRRTVQMHVNRLIKMGYLIVEPQLSRSGGFTANCYTLLYPTFKPIKVTIITSLTESEDGLSVAKQSFA